MIDLDDLKPWLTGFAVIALAGLAWFMLLQHGNARIEAKCINNGGTVLQRTGQPSYCLVSTLDTATTITTEGRP